MSSFSISFPKWEITEPYQLLSKIISNIDFPNYLHCIMCSKNKNISNISLEVSSSIHLT